MYVHIYQLFLILFFSCLFPLKDAYSNGKKNREPDPIQGLHGPLTMSRHAKARNKNKQKNKWKKLL